MARTLGVARGMRVYQPEDARHKLLSDRGLGKARRRELFWRASKRLKWANLISTKDVARKMRGHQQETRWIGISFVLSEF